MMMSPGLAVLDAIRFVLVEPRQPGNMGAAARALRTMGLRQLVLVRPVRPPDLLAEWRAAGGADVLQRATTVASVDDALADCVLVAATSARDRRIPWPLKDLRNAAADLLQAARQGPVAVLFGRETSGLTNDELQRAHLHVQIPADATYGVLNLAMAVQIVAYELRLAALGAAADIQPVWDQPPATVADQQRLLTHLTGLLERIGYYHPDHPRQTLTRLRRLVLRARLDEVEVRMLRGILKLLEP